MTLKSKDVAVMIGCSRGLGAEMVKLLKHEYNVERVIVIDINEPQAPNTEFHKCDVGDEQAYNRVLTEIINSCNEKRQKIRLFVHNAGIRHSSSLLLIEPQQVKRLYNVNVFLYIWGVRKVLQNHISQHSDAPLSVVAVSSVLSILAPKNLSVYSSTKASLSQLHEGLAQELKGFPNIRPLLVLPGQLLVGMFDDISPSRTFFAPIVNHIDLAKEIINKVNRGECGVICKPLYGNLLPLVKCLPYSLIKLCRWFSQMDEKVTDK